MVGLLGLAGVAGALATPAVGWLSDRGYPRLASGCALLIEMIAASSDSGLISGYSLPREDQFARFVLRRAIRNNLLNQEKGRKFLLAVRVVNPDEVVWTTLSRLVGGTGSATEMEFKQTLFQDYVATL